MTNLLINIDHVATLRNARRERFPDPVHAAVLCEAAGADGIVFHLREDRRHIKDRDAQLLKEVVRGRLDFELSTNPEIVELCCTLCPHVATLVPERREEVTTEGGLDVVSRRAIVETTVERLVAAEIEQVAIFVDPVLDQIQASKEAGANAIELHTGDYANAATEVERAKQLEMFAEAAAYAHGLELTVHAGHGLDYSNITPFLKTVPHVEEVSIGFAIIADAVLAGLPHSVSRMHKLIAST